MNVTKHLVKSKNWLKKQSPTILTCIGAVGVVATAVTAVRATPKALDLCADLRHDRLRVNGEEPTKLDYVLETWTCYLPSAAIGAATIAAIFAANVLGKRQIAALSSAYIFLNRSYKDYINKVKDIYGEEADKQVKAAMAKEKYSDDGLLVKSSDGDNDYCIFYEEHYGKFFERTMLEVREAEYQLNRKLCREGEASLNDFFELLDLPKSEIGEMFGWSQEDGYDFYGCSWIEFSHDLVSMEEGMECYIINTPFGPSVGYNVPF